ncbi:MAG: hypothetical protein QOG04_2207 [Actinomycetota bacterium]|jgi:amino acid transporter|nr:hypothetical protein [Actinomycetota bacterium]
MSQIQRFNEWGRRHPWRAAPAMAVFLFCITMAFAMLVLDQSAGEALPHSLIYSIGFPVLTAALNTWRYRRGE